MAHLWNVDGEGRWSALILDERPYSLALHPPVPLDTAAGGGGRGPRMMPSRGPEGLAWAVMARDPLAVLVGGHPLALGLRVLSDRDEIRVEGVGTLFFSTEVVARIEPFPPGDRDFFCGRCKSRIEPGALAVCCPGCGVFHHQSEEFLCWTYAETCSACAWSTDLDAGFRWTPEDL